MPRTLRVQSSLKHGFYTARTILPGESVEDFEALHAQLVADYAPAGVLEADTVRTIAKLVWRKGRLHGLKRAPPRPMPSYDMIMDPQHARYEPGKWTYAMKRSNVPDAPPPPPYVASLRYRQEQIEPPALSPDVEADGLSGGPSVADCARQPTGEADDRPTLEAVMEECAIEASFDAQVRHQVLHLSRLKGLAHLVKGRRAIDVTPKRAVAPRLSFAPGEQESRSNGT